MSEDCTVVRFSREPSSARIENLKQNDFPEKNYTDFGGFYVTCVLLSVITYIADLVLVCVLLYFYSIDGHGVYFALTLSFLLVPALLMTAFNFRWWAIFFLWLGGRGCGDGGVISTTTGGCCGEIGWNGLIGVVWEVNENESDTEMSVVWHYEI